MGPQRLRAGRENRRAAAVLLCKKRVPRREEAIFGSGGAKLRRIRREKAQNVGCNLSFERGLYGSEALQRTGGSNAEPLAHEEAEVEGRQPESGSVFESPPARGRGRGAGLRSLSMCANPRSSFSPLWRSSRLPRLPRIRRRLP